MDTLQYHNDTLPVPNPSASYWRRELHHLDSHRSKRELPKTTDVAIIGAGIAGVATAYHLSKSPNPPSILLIEARQTCSGATGRNGGHVKVKTATLMNTAQKLGVEASEEVARFAMAHIYALKDVVEKEDMGAECEFEVRRSYDVFLSERDAEAMKKAWKVCLERGDKWTRDRSWIGPEMAENVTGIKGAKAAFSVPACSMWPYKFVMGLLERTMGRNKGLNVQTETPVLEVKSEDGASLVVTSRGTIKAQKVIFATNAYTAGLLPQYRGTITPYKGTCAHLAAPDGKAPVSPHLATTYNIDYGLNEKLETVDYLNPRPDGGIVVGGGKWIFEEQLALWHNTVDDSTLFAPIIKGKYFDGYIQRSFRGWEDSETEAEKIWTGIMGGSPDGMAHIGAVPEVENQWILAGFNGGGMSQIFLSAKGVTKMVLDGVSFEDSKAGIPAMFQTTKARLENA